MMYRCASAKTVATPSPTSYLLSPARRSTRRRDMVWLCSDIVFSSAAVAASPMPLSYSGRSMICMVSISSPTSSKHRDGAPAGPAAYPAATRRRQLVRINVSYTNDRESGVFGSQALRAARECAVSAAEYRLRDQTHQRLACVTGGHPGADGPTEKVVGHPTRDLTPGSSVLIGARGHARVVFKKIFPKMVQHVIVPGHAKTIGRFV
jgi:hypothetical protein